MKLSSSPPAVSSPHARQPLSTGRLMLLVIMACLPGLLALTWFFGWGSLINILWLCLLAVGLEALVVRLRGRDPRQALADNSALVTAVLLGLALPPAAPWWAGLTGVFFAIVIAKHLYGGMGYNPFNPAMVGYVVLLISFPMEMTTWVSPRDLAEGTPTFSESLSAIFLPGSAGVDAYSGATPLDTFKQEQGGMLAGEFMAAEPLFGRWAGAGWEWVNLGFLAGGLWLLWRGIINWRIPAAMLGTLALLALFFHDGGSAASHGPPLLHLLAGGTMLGAFFIATDPVTAATTPRGRLIYGALVGALVFVIRAWGNYPDAVAFAVLLGNFAAPFIDAYTRPRTFGHADAGKKGRERA